MGKSAGNISDFVTILRSRKLAQDIIKKLNLEKNDDFNDEKADLNYTVENFQKKVKVFSPTNKDSSIRVKVRSKDKELGVKIANLHFTELKKYLELNNYLLSTKNRKFIEKQLKTTNYELKESENLLMNFKKENKTISLPEEVNQYIKYLSEIDAQELKSKIELNDITERIKVSKEGTSQFNEQMNNFIKDLKISQAGIKTKTSVLEEAKNKYTNLLNSLPTKALLLARLEREVKIKNTLYLILTQQYEIAKIEEQKELEPFKILDSGYTNYRPVFPKKITIIGIVFFVSLLIGILFSFFLEYLKNQKASYIKIIN